MGWSGPHASAGENVGRSQAVSPPHRRPPPPPPLIAPLSIPSRVHKFLTLHLFSPDLIFGFSLQVFLCFLCLGFSAHSGCNVVCWERAEPTRPNPHRRGLAERRMTAARPKVRHRHPNRLQPVIPPGAALPPVQALAFTRVGSGSAICRWTPSLAKTWCRCFLPSGLFSLKLQPDFQPDVQPGA